MAIVFNGREAFQCKRFQEGDLYVHAVGSDSYVITVYQ